MTEPADPIGQAEPADRAGSTDHPGPADPHRHYVQSLAKGLAVIGCFDAGHQRRTLSSVAAATGLTRASARRFLLTLVDLGYVARDGDQFSLRPTVLNIGRAYLSMLTLPELAEPHMRALSNEVGEAVSLCVLDEGDAVVVAQSRPGRTGMVQTSVGSRLHANSSAAGRCLLAGMSDDELISWLRHAEIPKLTKHTTVDRAAILDAIRAVRRAGYSIVDQEFRMGISAIAMPVYQASDTPAAAITLSARSRRISGDALEQTMLPKLQLTAHAIESALARRSYERQHPDPIGTRYQPSDNTTT